MIILHGHHNTDNTKTEDDDNNVHINVNESKEHPKMCTSKPIIYFGILKCVVYI